LEWKDKRTTSARALETRAERTPSGYLTLISGDFTGRDGKLTAFQIWLDIQHYT